MEKKNLIYEFMNDIEEIRFATVDDFFQKKEFIKDKFQSYDIYTKEMYKWYFFYQLCLIKYPLKSAFWDYLNGNDNLPEVSLQYRLFCERRNKINYNSQDSNDLSNLTNI